VREQVGQVLRIDSTRIERRAPFKSLGVDSLMSLEVRNRLETSLGFKLPATLLFTYSTVAVLAEYMLSEITSATESQGPTAPQDASIDVEEPPEVEVSDDDLLAAFDASARRIKKEIFS
jgi:acyl carrier protein